MRFRTIWTAPAMSLRERFSRTGEWILIKLAALVPQRLAYWITLREIGKATMDSPHVPAETVDTVLKNMTATKRR